MFAFTALTPQLVITQWSDTLADLTGRPAPAMVGRQILDAFPELRARGIDAALRHVLEVGAPLVLSNRLHGCLFVPANGAAAEQTAQIQPVRENGQIAGLMIVVRDVNDRLATESEIHRRAEHLEALREIDRCILADDPQPALDIVVRRCVSFFSALFAEVALLDGGRLIVQAAHGIDFPAGKMPTLGLDEGIIGAAARTGQPIRLLDVQSDPRYVTWDPRARAEMAVPLVVEGRVLGVLNVESDHPSSFTGSAPDLLKALAGETAVVVHSIRARAAEARRYAELDALGRLSAAMRQAANRAEIQSTVLDEVVATFGAETAAIVYPNPDGETLDVAETRGWDGSVSRLPINDSLAGIVFSTGGPTLSNHIQQDHRVYRPVKAQISPERIAALYAPLRAGQRIIGVLLVGAAEPREFSAADLRLFATVAEMAGAALHRASLHEETARRARQLAVLNDVGRQLASIFDPLALCELTVNTLVEQFDYALALAAQLDPAASEIVVKAKAGPMAEKISPGRRTPANRGIMACVVNTRRSYLSNNCMHDPTYVRWDSVDTHSELCVPVRIDGEVAGALNVEQPFTNAFSRADIDMLEALANQLGIALGNARRFQRIQNTAMRLAALETATANLARTDGSAAVMSAILDFACLLTQAKRAAIFVADAEGNLQASRAHGFDVQAIPPVSASSGIFGEAARTGLPVEVASVAADPRTAYFLPEIGSELYCIPVLSDSRIIAFVALDRIPPDDEARTLLETFCSRAAVAIEKTALHEETARLAHERAALLDISTAMTSMTDLDAVYRQVLSHCCFALGVETANLGLLIDHDSALQIVADMGAGTARQMAKVGRVFPLSEMARSRDALDRKQAIATVSVADDSTILPGLRDWFAGRGVRSIVYLPLIARQRAIGLVWLYAIDQERRFTGAQLSLGQGIANQAAVAIQRAQLHNETRRRLQRLEILRNIDLTITSSLDLNLTLDVVLNEITTRLGMDAASVLLLRGHSRTLEYAAGRGYRTDGIMRSLLRLGEGQAGKAALEKVIVLVPDLADPGVEFPRARQLAGEKFVSYVGVPLIAKGRAKGVLEIFSRTRFEPDAEWLEFFEALANQTAIAIDNAELFSGVQRSNVELALAYDSTIEGWSRALDLRDRETEGHTRRVTEMALRLARAMGFKDEELIQVRRGALLHDIGKMGVPDNILLKPGPLTDEEWVVMRRHPTYARDMLSPIAYLRPALDIPYCHHEKWDGSGYPRGLAGEQIPLAARIFAIADVWDALTSDRPYRKAWTPEQAREHICQSAGRHFDPRIVDTFLEISQDELRDGAIGNRL